jgi:hypothetical protein
MLHKSIQIVSIFKTKKVCVLIIDVRITMTEKVIELSIT